MRVISILSATALVLVGISQAAPITLTQRSNVEIRSKGVEADTEYSPYFSQRATSGVSMNSAIDKRHTPDIDGEGTEQENEEEEEEPEEPEEPEEDDDGLVASSVAAKKTGTGVAKNKTKQQTTAAPKDASTTAGNGQKQQEASSSPLKKVTGLTGGLTKAHATSLPTTPDLSSIAGTATGATGTAGLTEATDKIGQITTSPASILGGLTDGGVSSTPVDSAKSSADTLSGLPKPDDLNLGATDQLFRSPEDLTNAATNVVGKQGGSLL